MDFQHVSPITLHLLAVSYDHNDITMISIVYNALAIINNIIIIKINKSQARNLKKNNMIGLYIYN